MYGYNNPFFFSNLLYQVMRIRLIIFSFFFISVVRSQQVLVYFKDKGEEALVKLKQPADFLSEAAIERRILCNVELDYLDLPVNLDYLKILDSSGYEIASSSKWLNASLVNSSEDHIQALLKFPFVEKIEVLKSYPASKPNTTGTNSIYNYGNAAQQITMLNLDKLHDQGFTGNHVLIALLDAGFRDVNTLNAFKYLRDSNRIKAVRDFVNEDGDVYNDDAHGEEVFSVLASKLDGNILGSGFDADFLLARTENVSSETHTEEYNWMRAAEWADSSGARIIQSSLGYSDFDVGASYSPVQMDGKTAIISQAASIAARKGIVVVNSAGNEGDKVFRKITAPSDADSILCVGSVYNSGFRVMNSGQGPSADGRIKPDVMAMGGNTAYYSVSNTVVFGTGTSFACPLISGLCACLMQKNKYVTSFEMVDAIKRSADRFLNPDTFYGYGIPNAIIADTILRNISSGRGIIKNGKTYENYIKNTMVYNELLLNIEPGNLVVEIYSSAAACVYKKEIYGDKVDVKVLSPGIYYLKLNSRFAGKFIKQ
jgi:hypothetical protein